MDNLFRSEEHLKQWLEGHRAYKRLTQLPIRDFLAGTKESRSEHPEGGSEHPGRDAKDPAEGAVYFVCADFTSPEGKKTYDLDFWVKGEPRGLTVTDTTIHKEAGVPRYSWLEGADTWRRKPL